MEVNTNLSTLGLAGPISAKSAAGAAPPSPSNRADSTSLSTLDETLQSLPASRAQSVERARSLVADPQYPSAEIINRISQLLAAQLTDQEP
jgi:hypothetical protein